MQNALQSAAFLPLVTSIGSIGVALALWKGGVDLTPGSGLTLGTLIAFMQYAGLSYIPIQEMAARFTDLQGAQAAAERIQNLLDTEPEIRDDPNTLDQADPGGDEIETIEFRDVSFEYKKGNRFFMDSI